MCTHAVAYMHLPFLLQLEMRKKTRGKIPISFGEHNPGFLLEKMLSLVTITDTAWDSFVLQETLLFSQGCRGLALLFPMGEFAAKGQSCRPISSD